MSRFIDARNFPVPEVYKLMTGIIGPRPIGWISTLSKEGIPNLAPFSFFNLMGNNPAVLAFAPAISRDGRRKDSLLNAEATKCFVHNVVTRELSEVMNQTSEEFPYGVNEFEKVGLTALPSSIVSAPRVKEALINVECELNQIVSLGTQPGNGQIVFGNVVAIHINDESILDTDGLIRSESLRMISRLGRADYMDFGSVFRMSRPKS